MAVRYRWLHLGFIHTRLPLTAAQRVEIDRRSHAYAMKQRWFRRMLFLASAVLPFAVIGGGLAASIGLQQIIPSASVAWSIGFLGLCALSVALYLRIVWSWYKRPTRMALRDLGYEICVRCGYWLRGLADDVKRCPECGAARQAMAAADAEKPS